MGNVFITVLASFIYAVLGYLKNVGEGFDIWKFLATGIVGMCVGIGLMIIKVCVSYETITEYMLLSVGLVAVVENFLKIVVRRVLKFNRG